MWGRIPKTAARMRRATYLEMVDRKVRLKELKAGWFARAA
jgi:hypothetical protein